MSREDLHFRLRLPDALKTEIEQAARLSHRSMTAEIIARLEQTFSHDADITLITTRLEAAVKALESKL